MDNAVSHISGETVAFLNSNGINWFKTPAQSPDLNPIELVWLKSLLKWNCEAKHKTRFAWWYCLVLERSCHDSILYFEN